ncbi:MAG: type II toxin-antitoxin system Phd/YefM family antitoxin [Pyrinomonadaceae bacterium]|nr:type II toxin-antitoxin system Phd/YefM family antitoxin [Pyrinomonadaceae bacterium]MBP6212321.1 type II toxin-antitoxin system Phd/YefM family antitoxin [Pyrinomonadaceae bacterium]
MKELSVFEGKNKFSEVIANAAKGEPQLITKNGTATAVVISFGEYKRLTAKKESLSEFLLNSPLHGIGDELDLTRDKDMGRPTIDFDSEEFTGKTVK